MKPLLALTAFLVVFSPALAQNETQTLAGADTINSEQIINITVYKDGRTDERINTTTVIVTEKGRVLQSLVKFPYKPSSETVTVEGATMTTNGMISSVSKKKITDKAVASGATGLTDFHEIVIPFEGLQLKSKINYVIHKITKHPQIPGFYTSRYIYGLGAPELNSQVHIKSEIPLYTQSVDLLKQINIKQTVIAGWHTTDITMRRPIFSLRASDVAPGAGLMKAIMSVPQVVVSSAKTWNEFDDVLEKLYGPRMSEPLPPEAAQLLKSIDPKLSVAEKVSAVREWIHSHISYSGRWDAATSGFVPHPLATIISSKIADCKDFAFLFRRMTGELGIKTDFTFVQTFGTASVQAYISGPLDDKPYPSTYFDHAIVRVTDGNKVYFIDPTANLVQGETTDFHLAQMPSWTMTKDSTYSRIPLPSTTASEVENSISFTMDGMAVKSKVDLTGTMAQFLQTISPDNLAAALAAIAGFPGSERIKITKSPNNAKLSHLQYELEFTNAKMFKNEGEKAEFTYQSAFLASYWGQVFPTEPMRTLNYKIKKTTTFEGYFAPNETKSDCLARGPIVSTDRIVKNLGGKITITEGTSFLNRELPLERNPEDPMGEISGNLGEMGRCSTAKINLVKANPADKTQVPFEAGIDEIIKIKSIPPDRFYETLETRWRAFHTLIEKDPKNPEYYARMGNVFVNYAKASFKAGLPEYIKTATALYNKALETDHKYLKAWTSLGLIAIDQDKIHDALQYYQAASAIKPDAPSVYYLASKISTAQKDDEKAIAYLKLLENDLEYGENALLYEMNLLCKKKETCETATPLFGRYLAKSSEDPWALHNVAIEYNQMQNFEKAIELERKAIAKMDFGRAHLVLNEALSRRALDLSELDPRTGLAKSPTGLAEAEKLVAEAVSNNPEDYWSVIGLATLSMRKACLARDEETLDRTEAYIEKYANMKKNSPETLQWLQREYAKAKIIFAKKGRAIAGVAPKLNPDYPTAQQKWQNLMASQSGKDYDSATSAAIRSAMYSSARKCGILQGEAFGSVAVIDGSGAVTAWVTDFLGEDRTCLQKSMVGVKLSPPPTTPFYLEVGYRPPK